MKLFYFDKATGEITQWQTAAFIPVITDTDGQVKIDLSGYEIPPFGLIAMGDDVSADVGQGTHRVDLSKKRMIRKTASETAASRRRVTRGEVDLLVQSELGASDWTQLSDVTLSPEIVAAWRYYRSALRDLSDLNEAAAMLAGFPLRPDGVDAATALRARP